MRNHSALYRMPRNPGFVGGYNWKATIRGLAVLVLFNSLATQYVAWRFRYQPALGRPLFSDHHTSWYQPFAWCVWGWRYCTTDQSWIRRPLYQGEMIALAGCFVSVAMFYVFANRRARELSENAEDRRPDHGALNSKRPNDFIIVMCAKSLSIVRTDVGFQIGGSQERRSRPRRPGGLTVAGLSIQCPRHGDEGGVVRDRLNPLL